MDLMMLRETPRPGLGMLGEMFVAGSFECFTMEPDGANAIKPIPAGRYRLEFVDSPHFGPGTLHIKDVPGRDHVLIHGGNSVKDTLACVLVGDSESWDEGTIAGAARDRVLDKLKEKVRAAEQQPGGECWLQVVDA